MEKYYLKGNIDYYQKGYLDFDRKKPFSHESAMDYVAGHESLIMQFLDTKVRKKDREFVLNNLLEDPVFFATLININMEIPEEEKINAVVEKILHEGIITVLIGGKRMGKTAVGYWLLELLLKKESEKEIYWYGYSPGLKRIYPEIKQTLKLNELENALLLFDETLLTMMGRDAMTSESKERVRILPTIGHRDVSVIFMTQSLRIDPMILNMADALWFKPFFALDLGFEREDTNRRFKKILKFILPKQKEQNLFYDMHTNETYIFDNQLPERWCEELSKPFSKISSLQQAKEYFSMMEDAGFSDREIMIFLAQRGWDYNDVI